MGFTGIDAICGWTLEPFGLFISKEIFPELFITFGIGCAYWGINSVEGGRLKVCMGHGYG
jgi:hypothetical protein